MGPLELDGETTGSVQQIISALNDDEADMEQRPTTRASMATTLKEHDKFLIEQQELRASQRSSTRQCTSAPDSTCPSNRRWST